MNLLVRLLAKYALWIYILCGVGMVLYLRTALAARREGSQAIFSLERETAAGRIYRSSGMILLLLFIAIGVYALSNYGDLPALATNPALSPLPTIEEMATPTRRTAPPTPGEATPSLEPTPTRRSLSTVIALPTIVQVTPTSPAAAPASCPHANVRVLQPGQNQVIDSGIDVQGTATKEQFDRYEFKFKNRDTADEWHWVETFKTPVQNGSLGFWPTSHLPSGNYWFMLITIDITGNSQECVVPVVIQH
jgi:hypothetical protein